MQLDVSRNEAGGLQPSTDTRGRVRASVPACAWGGALGASGAEKSGRYWSVQRVRTPGLQTRPPGRQGLRARQDRV